MIDNSIMQLGLVSIVSLILLITTYYKCRQDKARCVSTIRSFFIRQQPEQSLSVVIKSGVGGLITIGFISVMGYFTDSILLMAPLGATCVLLFSVPQSPLSQPVNVVASHIISTTIGLLLHLFLPTQWWALGLAVGLAIAVMALLRITHPPAGADPLVVFFTNPGLDYIIFPVAAGSVALVIIAWFFHKLPMQTPYPLPAPVTLKPTNKTHN